MKKFLVEFIQVLQTELTTPNANLTEEQSRYVPYRKEAISASYIYVPCRK